MKNIGILFFTERGKHLAQETAARLARQGIAAELFDKEKAGAGEYLAENFEKKDTFLFICAAGIAVRLIAPFIKRKDIDPAVVVMDELGHWAVPLLSGHLGGANEAAEIFAEAAGAQVVLTTATDINGRFAVDVWSKGAGCAIMDVSGIKTVSAAVLAGEKVGFQCEFPVTGALPAELFEIPAESHGAPSAEPRVGICVSLSGKGQPFQETFHVVPKIVTVGAGCRKGVSSRAFEEFILKQLSENGIALQAVEQICSIDLKKEEPCILDFSEKYQIPFVTYTAEELRQIGGDFTTSELVQKVTGVDNVCERSAAAGSGMGKSILSKTSGGGMTCALAVKDWECKF